MEFEKELRVMEGEIHAGGIPLPDKQMGGVGEEEKPVSCVF